MKLEEMCVWKKMHTPESTTFQEVERVGIECPLYKCVKCDGYDFECNGYRVLKKQCGVMVAHRPHKPKTAVRFRALL